MAHRELTFRVPRIARHISLTDGSIKAEPVKRARIMTDSLLKVMPKGAWLEIAKTKNGEGVLRVRNPERNKVLFTLPVNRVNRLNSPSKHLLGTGSRFPNLRQGLFSRCRGIFEVEGTNQGHTLHATFAVKDPDGWMAAMSAPEWSS